MAVVNTKSNEVTNQDRRYAVGLPNVPNPRIRTGGVLKSSTAVVAVAAGDSANSVYRFFRVRSNIQVRDILIQNGANGAGGVMDVGVYDTAENGGAVVDQDAFGAAQSVAAAATKKLSTLANLASAANAEKTLWELLGLSADPGKSYDICGTLTTNGGTGVSIALELRFVDDAN